jgi:hypothetical protein
MKLFKITMEHTFVVVDLDDATVLSVEKSLRDILRLHGSDILEEPATNALAEPVNTKDDLPEGWDGNGILPYSRFSAAYNPNFVNLSINQILKRNAKPPVKEGTNKTKYVVRLRGPSHSQADYVELLTGFKTAEDAAAEIAELVAAEKKKGYRDDTQYYIVKVNFTETEELINTITDDSK